MGHSDKCLTLQEEREGGNVVQDVCEPGRDDQSWTVQPAPDGYSHVKFNKRIDGKQMCLDKASGDITVWTCHDGWWQQWSSLH